MPGTEAFVAVVVDQENHTLAYVCDGKEIAEWFRGAVALDGALNLRSDGGAMLRATVSGDEAEGTLAFGGEEHAFAAEPAEEPAGLYRAEESVEGEEYVGGWILLNNGEERGAVKNTSTGFIEQTIGLARLSEPVDGVFGQNIDL